MRKPVHIPDLEKNGFPGWGKVEPKSAVEEKLDLMTEQMDRLERTVDLLVQTLKKSTSENNNNNKGA